MLKKTLFLLGSTLLLVLGYLVGVQNRGTAVYAQMQPRRQSGSIPKSWGSLRTIAGNAYFFEDAAGTVRAVEFNEKPGDKSKTLYPVLVTVIARE